MILIETYILSLYLNNKFSLMPTGISNMTKVEMLFSDIDIKYRRFPQSLVTMNNN